MFFTLGNKLYFISREKLWKMVIDFTGGDLSFLPDLIELSKSQQNGQPSFVHDNIYVGQIIEIYL